MKKVPPGTNTMPAGQALEIGGAVGAAAELGAGVVADAMGVFGPSRRVAKNAAPPPTTATTARSPTTSPTLLPFAGGMTSSEGGGPTSVTAPGEGAPVFPS